MRLDRRHARLLFIGSWLIYFMSYLGRLNYSAVMSELIDTYMTKSQAGWINTAFLVAYATGQLVNGQIAEKVSPRIMVALGTAGAGLCNILFMLTRSYMAWLIIRLFTGICMSMIWPSIFHAMVVLMQRDDKINYSVEISSSMAAGSLVSYVMNAAFLNWFDWRAGFIVPGVLLTAFGCAWFMLYDRLASKADVAEAEQAASVSHKAVSLKALIFAPCLAVAVFPVIMHGAIKDGVTAWVPAYISEVFGASPAFSSLISVLLPLFNLMGTYMSRFMYKRCGENEFVSASVFFAVAAAGFCLMITLGMSALPVTMFCFALVTSCMMAANILLINLLPLRFEANGRTSTVSGGLNAIAYGGSAAASAIIGIVSEAYGWHVMVLSWMIIMVLSGLICWVFRNTGTWKNREA